jgi:hypothetical protein
VESGKQKRYNIGYHSLSKKKQVEDKWKASGKQWKVNILRVILITFDKT